jgi:hypothetical protein
MKAAPIGTKVASDPENVAPVRLIMPNGRSMVLERQQGADAGDKWSLASSGVRSIFSPARMAAIHSAAQPRAAASSIMAQKCEVSGLTSARLLWPSVEKGG